MNIFDKLPFFGTDAADQAVALTTEEQAAEAKAARIKFHREQVRNGPVKWNSVTAGQDRRAKVRALARQQKRAYRNEVKNYLETQRVAASVRAHLQAVGIISFHRPIEVALDRQIASTVWLVQRFGVEVEVKDGPNHMSFKADDVLSALRGAAKFYSNATGGVFTVPAGFEPAIVEVD